MMTIIDLARNIRERHNKPLKTPLRYISIKNAYRHVCLNSNVCKDINWFHIRILSFLATTGRWL